MGSLPIQRPCHVGQAAPDVSHLASRAAFEPIKNLTKTKRRNRGGVRGRSDDTERVATLACARADMCPEHDPVEWPRAAVIAFRVPVLCGKSFGGATERTVQQSTCPRHVWRLRLERQSDGLGMLGAPAVPNSCEGRQSFDEVSGEWVAGLSICHPPSVCRHYAAPHGGGPPLSP